MYEKCVLRAAPYKSHWNETGPTASLFKPRLKDVTGLSLVASTTKVKTSEDMDRFVSSRTRQLTEEQLRNNKIKKVGVAVLTYADLREQIVLASLPIVISWSPAHELKETDPYWKVHCLLQLDGGKYVQLKQKESTEAQMDDDEMNYIDLCEDVFQNLAEGAKKSHLNVNPVRL